MGRYSYSSIHSFAQVVTAEISAGQLATALELVHGFVERIFTEPLCTTRVYGSETLDTLCASIGAKTLAGWPAAPSTASFRAGDPNEECVVYIVTKLQKSGGHSRVIRDLIQAKPGVRHLIFSTELNGRSDSENIPGMSRDGKVEFHQAPHGSYLDKLNWLQRLLIASKPVRTYLFNDHADSVAVAAIQPGMALDAYFYHHADHHLCLGVFNPNFKHVDPHPMGYHNCRKSHGIENIYVPLTIDDQGTPPARSFLDAGSLTTCTAGRSNKIEIPYHVSYLELVPKILKTTGGRHIHIGRLSPWGAWKIRRGMKKLGVPSDRFLYIPWVPSVWKTLHELKVDLYIASFPYGGGLTLIEAMGAGVPVALHKHMFSSILSGIELAYPSAFVWRTPGELLRYCQTATSADLKEAGRLGRRQYDSFHTGLHLKQAVGGEILKGLMPPAPSVDFEIESDEQALWMERQLSLKRLIARSAYRLLRRMRARW